MYGKSLTFECSKVTNDIHVNKVAISRPLPASFRCLKCSKIAREAEKQNIREEQRRQNAHYSKMQEQMFNEARI